MKKHRKCIKFNDFICILSSIGFYCFPFHLLTAVKKIHRISPKWTHNNNNVQRLSKAWSKKKNTKKLFLADVSWADSSWWRLLCENITKWQMCVIPWRHFFFKRQESCKRLKGLRSTHVHTHSNSIEEWTLRFHAVNSQLIINNLKSLIEFLA